MPPTRTTKKAQPRTRTRPTTKDTSTPIPTRDDPAGKYAPDAWLSGGIGGMEDLTVPSGQLCLVRRPGVQGLIAAGVLRNIDSLSALVQNKHVKKGKGKGKAEEEVDIESIMKDPEALNNVMHTVDKVVCHCVVKPEIHMSLNDVTQRKAGVVYADMVDIMDKMFLFNFVVGGTRDLETFRGGLDSAVGSVEDGDSVSGEAQ